MFNRRSVDMCFQRFYSGSLDIARFDFLVLNCIFLCLINIFKSGALAAWSLLLQVHILDVVINRNSTACALCWFSKILKLLGDHRNRPSVQVQFLPPGVALRDVQDMKIVLERLLDVFSKVEVKADRLGHTSLSDDGLVCVTHVDRIFGWLQLTRTQCMSCKQVSERTTLPKSVIFTFCLKVSECKSCTVNDLYIDSLLPQEEVLPCSHCVGLTSHQLSSRLATTPQHLIMWLDRSSVNETVLVDVEEDLSLPGLVNLRLVSVVYKARRSDGIGCYSCVCRGPMDAWWYFEEGRAPEPIRGSVSHVKRGLSCMIIYERVLKHGRAFGRKANGIASIESRRSRKIAVPISSCPAARVSPLLEWPLRALKRYPSWVDHLKMERISQDLIVEHALKFVRDSYFHVVGGNGVPIVCYTSAFEFASVGASLGEMTLQFISKFNSTLMLGVFSSREERSVFACSCVAHACQQLAFMSTVHDQLRTVCGYTFWWCLAETMISFSEFQGVLLDIVSRVTRINNLDPSELERQRLSFLRLRLECDAFLLGPRLLHCGILPDAGGEGYIGSYLTQYPASSDVLGDRLCDGVMNLTKLQGLLSREQEVILAYSCISNVFAVLALWCGDPFIGAIYSCARFKCIREAKSCAVVSEDANAFSRAIAAVIGVEDFSERDHVDQASVNDEDFGNRLSGFLSSDVRESHSFESSTITSLVLGGVEARPVSVMSNSSSENSKTGCALNLSHDSPVLPLRRSVRLAGSSQIADLGTFPEPAATNQSESEICSGGAQASVGAAISSLETSFSLFDTPKARRVLKRACDLDATSLCDVDQRVLKRACDVDSPATQPGLKRAGDCEASSPVQIGRLVWSPAISDFDHRSSVVVISESDSESGFDVTACSAVAPSVPESFDGSSGSFASTTAGDHVAIVGASSIDFPVVSPGPCSSSVTALSVKQTVGSDAASCGSVRRRSARVAAAVVERTARLSESSQLGGGLPSIARSID